MNLAHSTIEKYKEALLLCLKKLKGAKVAPINDKEYLEYLIMWLKVRQICLNAQKLLQNDSSKADDSRTYSSLLEKFNQQIQPKLAEYMKNLKNRPLSERILTFNHRMQEYSALVQDIITEKPHEAMKVYEESRIFLLIYQFTLDQVFIRDIRSNLHKKMLDLTNIIEKIEAGDTELIQKQSEDLKHKISNQEITEQIERFKNGISTKSTRYSDETLITLRIRASHHYFNNTEQAQFFQQIDRLRVWNKLNDLQEKYRRIHISELKLQLGMDEDEVTRILKELLTNERIQFQMADETGMIEFPDLTVEIDALIRSFEQWE
ncbi:MAG: hypothetical protein E4G98_05525, partial [Promethearchaeota archaeon]